MSTKFLSGGFCPDTVEIASLEGLTLWCSEISQSEWLLSW